MVFGLPISIQIISAKVQQYFGMRNFFVQKNIFYCIFVQKKIIYNRSIFFNFVNMNTEKDIIANILQIRMKKRLTQKDLSIALGVSEATYNRIESGKITLSYNHIAKIARAFSMSIIDIITYPEIYSPAVKIPSSKRIIVELDLSEEEFINTGLRDKVIQNLNNRR